MPLWNSNNTSSPHIWRTFLPTLVREGPYYPTLHFTRNAATGTSPLIVAPTADDSAFVWTGPGGTFYGKQPNISNFTAGDFTLYTTVWDAVTQLSFNDRKLTYFELQPVLPYLQNLTSLALYSNSSLTSGNISDWVFPETLTVLRLDYTDLPGDITNWIFPDSLQNLYVTATAVTGDISGWSLPSAGYIINLASTALTGDLSYLIPGANLFIFSLSSSSFSYGTNGMFSYATRNNSIYLLGNNSMTTAEVDRILSDCNTSGTTGSTLNVAGTNQAPTGGATNPDYLALLGKGWTVTIS